MKSKWAFWGAIAIAFVFWKFVFSTDPAKDLLRSAVTPGAASSPAIPGPPSPAAAISPAEPAPVARPPQSSTFAIPDGVGISASTRGLSPQGVLLIQVTNDSPDLEVRYVLATLTNVQQAVDVLNGNRTAPAYAEHYAGEVSIPPKGKGDVTIPTSWDPSVGYTAKITLQGGPAMGHVSRP